MILPKGGMGGARVASMEFLAIWFFKGFPETASTMMLLLEFFRRKSNFNGLLRIFVFMRYPKTAWIHPTGGMGGVKVASMEFLAMRLHEILGN